MPPAGLLGNPHAHTSSLHVSNLHALSRPAMQELDPAGKFSGAGKGARNIWQFNATRGGQPVPFASCCGPQGFLPECQCARRTCS